MLPDAAQFVKEVIDLLGDSTLEDVEIEARVLEFTGDRITTRGLIDFIPEAFGYVLLAHMDRFQMESNFQAMDLSGNWIEFPMKAEPIVPAAAQVALAMYHDGPRDRFKSIAERSAVVDSASKMLNDNPDAKGIVTGPALLGIPAEIYLAHPYAT